MEQSETAVEEADTRTQVTTEVTRKRTHVTGAPGASGRTHRQVCRVRGGFRSAHPGAMGERQASGRDPWPPDPTGLKDALTCPSGVCQVSVLEEDVIRVMSYLCSRRKVDAVTCSSAETVRDGKATEVPQAWNSDQKWSCVPSQGKANCSREAAAGGTPWDTGTR